MRFFLSNLDEHREAIRSASPGIAGFPGELQLLDKEQRTLSSSWRHIGLPIQAPDSDTLRLLHVGSLLSLIGSSVASLLEQTGQYRRRLRTLRGKLLAGDKQS